MFFFSAFLYTVCFINIFLGLVAFIFQWQLMIFVYNVLGVIIFSGYILFDTWLILHKIELQHIDTGTAIAGALRLYLDIINLFLHLLQLMRRRRPDSGCAVAPAQS